MEHRHYAYYKVSVVMGSTLVPDRARSDIAGGNPIRFWLDLGKLRPGKGNVDDYLMSQTVS